jgi:hypothetical protein
MANTVKTVTIVVDAKDQASKTLTGIGHTLSTAIGTFAGGAALKLATKGFDALTGVIGDGISDARDAAKVFAQTQSVIKSTGGAAGVTADQIADIAGSLSAAAGKSLFGDDDIQRGQNMLLTFTNIKETLPDTTQVMLDLAQATGTDMQSAALMLGKALNDPAKQMGALRRQGVAFTAEQENQIKAMQASGDMAGAQKVILAELNKEFGGSAAAAAAADGGFAELQDTLGETAESIGKELLPLGQELVGLLNSPDVKAGIAAFAVGLVGAIHLSVDAFKGLMVVLGPVIGFIKDNLTAVLAALGTMLAIVVIPAFVAWAAAAGAAALATIAALAPVLIPIALIGAAVGLLVTAWNKDWGGMRTTLTAWWTKTVQPILKTIWDVLSTNIPKALNTLKGVWDNIWGFLTRSLNGFIKSFNALITLMNKIPGVNLGLIGGGGIVGSVGGQSVIGAQVAGVSARGVPLYLPSGFARSSGGSIAPRRGGERPAVTLDMRGATFGGGLTEPQLRGWIGPVVEDALRRFETGMMRDTSDLATRGALR